MARILAACLLLLASQPALAAASLSDRMQALLPAVADGWTSTGAKAKEVPEGPSKGAVVFQVYQKKARTVIVRLTENPPRLVRKILAKPGEYGYRPHRFKGRDAIMKEKKGSGGLLVRVGRFLVSVDWSGAATRDDAMIYANAIDVDAVAQLD